jgi:hypothetical protein
MMCGVRAEIPSNSLSTSLLHCATDSPNLPEVRLRGERSQKISQLLRLQAFIPACRIVLVILLDGIRHHRAIIHLSTITSREAVFVMNIGFIGACICALVSCAMASGCITSRGIVAKATNNMRPNVLDSVSPGAASSGVLHTETGGLAPLSIGKPTDDKELDSAIQTALRSRIPEIDKAKLHAYQLAVRIGNVKKIKICWDKKFEEWRFTLYHDVGDYYDLKQFFWKIDATQPEKFCVLRHLAKDRLNEAAAEPDGKRACSVFEPVPSFIQSVLTSVAPKKNESEISDVESPLASVKPGGATRKAGPIAKLSPEDHPLGVPAEKEAGEASKETKRNVPERSVGVTSISVESSRKAVSICEPMHAARDARTPPDARKLAKPKPEKDQSSTLAKNPILNAPTSLETKARKAPPLFKAPSIESGGKIIAVSDEGIPDKRQRIEPDLNHVSSLGQLTSDRHPEGRTSFVFVYGSEMNHQELMQWIEQNGEDPSAVLDAAPAVLEGYEYVWNFFSASRNAGTVNIEPHPDRRVYGLLLEVEEGLLRAFDARAGHPRSYSRGDERLAVKRVDDCRSFHAWTYRAKPNRAGRRSIFPKTEYKRKIVEAAMFWQFPKDYVEKLRDWPTQQ